MLTCPGATIKKFFQKGIAKSKVLWYNIVTNEREVNKMMMFIIGFVAAWLLLGIFFYMRDSGGGWSIWGYKWDVYVMILPAIPIILLIEIIEDKVLKK